MGAAGGRGVKNGRGVAAGAEDAGTVGAESSEAVTGTADAIPPVGAGS
jgi:hypothetical protein